MTVVLMMGNILTLAESCNLSFRKHWNSAIFSSTSALRRSFFQKSCFIHRQSKMEARRGQSASSRNPEKYLKPRTKPQAVLLPYAKSQCTSEMAKLKTIIDMVYSWCDKRGICSKAGTRPRTRRWLQHNRYSMATPD